MKILLFLFIAALPCGAFGRDIYVSPLKGSDARDGLRPAPDSDSGGPVATIKHAISLAQPGDTIHLDPAASPYYEQVLFSSKSGTAEKPIVFDGHGAVIDGSVPIRPEEWEDAGNGLYKSAIIAQTYCYGANPAYVGRFYFLWDNRMNRMGRSLKGGKEPFKSPAELKPGEWTWQEEEKTFYLRVPAGTTLEENPIRLPKIVSGVQITGQCHHLVIRNLTATHVINDGFALTVGDDKSHTVRDIRFENITAVECGDDGLSAHGDCEVTVDGFLSRRNSTGYCSQGQSINRRVRIEEIDGFEIYPIGGRHEFIDSVVIGHALRPVQVEPAPPFTSTELVLRNCLILSAPNRDPATALIRVGAKGKLVAENLTTEGLSFLVSDGGEADLSHSLITGGPAFYVHLLPGAKWRGSHNHYDIAYFRRGDERFPPADFERFAKETGETGSVLSPVKKTGGHVRPGHVSESIGADPTALPLDP